MNQLSIFCDSPVCSEDIRSQLVGLFNVRLYRIDKIEHARPDQYTVFDVRLNEDAHLQHLKDWLKQRPKDGEAIFVTDKTTHLETVRARALGATDIVHRPLDRRMLLSKLWGEFESLTDAQWDFSAQKSEGVVAAYGALQDIFPRPALAAL